MFLRHLFLAFVSLLTTAHAVERLGYGNINLAPCYKPVSSLFRVIPRMTPAVIAPLGNAVVPLPTPQKNDVLEKVHYGAIDALFVQAQKYSQNNPLNPDHKGRLYTASSQSFNLLSASLQEGSSPWFSPQDVNLYTTLEIACTPDVLQHRVHLPHLTCLSISQVLDQYRVPSSIRWPNDVMVNHQKISGIGIKIDGSVFINIGLNVNMTKQDCETIDQPATSLFLNTNQITNVDHLLNHLTDTFFKNLETIKHTGGSEVRNSVVERLAYKDTAVTLSDGPQNIKGIIKGLDKNGFLILAREDGTETTHCTGSVRQDVEHHQDPHNSNDNDPTPDLLTKATVLGGAEYGRRVVKKEVKVQSVQPYEVGTFKDLQKRSTLGDGLEIHHAPQKHPAQQVIPSYNEKTAPSIALPREEHRLIPNVKGPYEGTPRQLLAQDTQNLRKYTTTPNKNILELVDKTKQQYPQNFTK